MTTPIKIVIHTRLEAREPVKVPPGIAVSDAGAKMVNILQLLERFRKATTATEYTTYQGSGCVSSPLEPSVALPDCCPSSGVSTPIEPLPEAPLQGRGQTAEQEAVQEDLTPEEAVADPTDDEAGHPLQGVELQKAMQQATAGRVPTVTLRAPLMPLPASDLSGAAALLWGSTHIPDKPRTWGEFLWGSGTPSLEVGRVTLGGASVERGNTEHRVLLSVYEKVCDSMPAKVLQVLYKKGGTHGCNLFCHALARYILGYERTRLQCWLGLNKPNQTEVRRRIMEAANVDGSQ